VTMTTLYRYEPKEPRATIVADWIKESAPFKNTLAASGRWFTDDPAEAQWYEQEHPGGHMVAVQVQSAEAETYRISNMARKAGFKDTVDNPAAFSRRPEREFFLPSDLAARKQPHP